MTDSITKKTNFDDGLTLVTGYVSENATNATKIIVDIGSGSADDIIHGEAHFLEHMLFNGVNTEQGEIDFKTLRQTRESKGMIFGADTTHTRTRYYAEVPNNLGIEGIRQAIYELSRMVISPTLPEARIDHEKKVICNEWGHRLGTVPTYLFEQSYISGFKSNSAYGHRILGEKQDVRQINRQNLLNFMADHYTKPNTVITVSGPSEHDVIAEIVGNNFADMPENDRPERTPATPLEPIYEVAEIGYISHNFFQINLPWEGSVDIDREPIETLARFLVLLRLNNTVREDRGTTYGLKVATDAFKEHGYLYISTDCEPHLVRELTKEIAYEINLIANGDISSDLQDIKTIITHGRRSNAFDVENFAANLAHYQREFGALYDIEKVVALYASVSVADIQETIRNSLKGPKAFLGIGQQDAFLDSQEFDQIMTLQHPQQSRSLGEEFKPRTMQ